VTPGENADRALTLIYRCGGELGYMVMKKKLKRSALLVLIEKLELAVGHLKDAAGENR